MKYRLRIGERWRIRREKEEGEEEGKRGRSGMRTMVSRTGDWYVRRLPSHLDMISLMTGSSFPLTVLIRAVLCRIVTARDRT